MAKVQTVEEIDLHIRKEKNGTTANTTVGPTSDLTKAYKIAKPVLLFAASLIVFKPSWSKVLSDLIAALDKVTGIK